MSSRFVNLEGGMGREELEAKMPLEKEGMHMAEPSRV